MSRLYRFSFDVEQLKERSTVLASMSAVKSRAIQFQAPDSEGWFSVEVQPDRLNEDESGFSFAIHASKLFKFRIPATHDGQSMPVVVGIQTLFGPQPCWSMPWKQTTWYEHNVVEPMNIAALSWACDHWSGKKGIAGRHLLSDAHTYYVRRWNNHCGDLTSLSASGAGRYDKGCNALRRFLDSQPRWIKRMSKQREAYLGDFADLHSHPFLAIKSVQDAWLSQHNWSSYFPAEVDRSAYDLFDREHAWLENYAPSWMRSLFHHEGDRTVREGLEGTAFVHFGDDDFQALFGELFEFWTVNDLILIQREQTGSERLSSSAQQPTSDASR